MSTLTIVIIILSIIILPVLLWIFSKLRRWQIREILSWNKNKDQDSSNKIGRINGSFSGNNNINGDERFAGDKTTDAPPPSIEKKKPKGK